MDNISFETVIIVACICGTVIAVLSLVLVILCCKRCRAKRMFEKMNRLNDQLSMNPLNGPSVIASSSEDQSLRQRAESRNSRVMEEVVSPHVVDRNGATYQVQGDHLHLARAGSPLRRDQNVHSSMLSVDQRPRKILYEVVV